MEIIILILSCCIILIAGYYVSLKIIGSLNRIGNAIEEIVAIIKPPPKKPLQFPLKPKLYNQTPPEPNFVGREDMLKIITEWYKNPNIKIGALINWGGFGKSALVRKWYDSLKENNIQPDGIFWWGFYRNPYLDRFLEELLRYLVQERFDLSKTTTAWQKAERIKKFIVEKEYLIILDGLEVMQKEEKEEFGVMKHREFQDILKYIAESNSGFKGLCLITTRFPLTDIERYQSYKKLDIEELSKEDTKLLFKEVGVKGTEEEIEAVWHDLGGHTLSLVLLAYYLTQYYSGNIKKVKEIPPFYTNKMVEEKIYRTLFWHDKQLNSNQRQFMKIFSLFGQAVSKKELDDIFLPLIKIKYSSFTQMVNNLCQRKLISKGIDNTYTIHPLIKDYFESIFDEKEKRAYYKVIYKYFDI